MKKILFLLFFPSFIFGFLGCDDTKTEPMSENETIDVTKSLSNDFSTNIFKAVIGKEAEDKNVVISPASISQVLLMILAGAEGNTADEIVSSFGKDKSSKELLDKTKAFNNWLDTRSGNSTISLSNAAFYDEPSLEILDGYESSLANNFQAELVAEDFSNKKEALSSINGWVDQNTNSRIPKILEDIGSDEVMFLVNALYLKADWENGFVEESTRGRDFTLEGGEVVQVPMMYADRGFSTFSDDDLVAVELPYKDDSLSMFLIKPIDGNVNGLILEFDADKMNEILGKSINKRLMFTMPKFDVEYKNGEVRKNLELLGVNQMFTDQADLRKMATRSNLAISRLVHKTYITVDEKGTEGAAVTVAGVVTTSLPPRVDFNSPFIFVILEKTHAEMLFLGRISDPR